MSQRVQESPTSPGQPAPGDVERGLTFVLARWRGTHLGPVAALVALWVTLAVTVPLFAHPANQLNLVRQNFILLVLALGMTFVILSGRLDLSVGSVLAASGVFCAMQLQAGVPPAVAMVLTVIAAGLFGLLVNGVLIGYAGLDSIVVTLGTLTAVRGAVFLVTGGQTVDAMRFTVLQTIANSAFLGLPTVGYIAIILIAAGVLALKHTQFGRSVYAIGGSREAAHHMGVNVARVEMAVYGISGALAGLTGIVAIGRTGSASPLVGQGFELTAIAAVVLGGTMLSGGIGGIGRTVVGVLFLGVLHNGMNLTGLQTFWQQVAVGVIVIIAVLFERLRSRREHAR